MAIKDYLMEGVGPTSAIKYVALRGLEPFNPVASGSGTNPLLYGISPRFGSQSHEGVTPIFSIKFPK